MQTIDASSWLSQAAVEKLGWVLVHSFWQLTAVALLAWLSDRALRRRSSSVRYLSLLFTLLLMIASPVVTWLMLPASPVDPVSAAKPDSASIARDTPAQTANQEPAAPIEIVEVPTTGSLDKPVATSASSGHWMNRCAEFLTPWLGTIVSVWSFGVLLFSVRPVVSWINVQRLKRRGTSAVAESVQQTLAMLSQKLQVRQRVDVLISTVVTSPIVVGCFRSVILLPASFIAGVPPAQLEAILAHELAHVKRYDYLVNLIQTLVETLFFYHPAVWWLSHRIRIERENCCDDMVVTALNNKVDYGRALFAIEELRGQVSALALSAKGGSLVARVRRLFSEPVHDGSQTAAGILSFGTLLAILMLAMIWPRAIASDETPKANEKPRINESEPPIATFEDGRSISMVGIRQNNTPREAAWLPNGKSVEHGDNRWNTSDDPIKSGRQILFAWDGFGNQPSIHWHTNPSSYGAGTHYVSRTLQLSTQEGRWPVGLPKETFAQIWVTDEPWSDWVAFDLDGTRIESLSDEQTHEGFCKLVKVSPSPGATENDPAIKFAFPDEFFSALQIEIVAVDSSGNRVICFNHAPISDDPEVFKPRLKEARNAGDPWTKFSHFAFRLRPYRYVATFRNFVIDGPTDKATEVKVEAKKLDDSEILASVNVTSPHEPEHSTKENQKPHQSSLKLLAVRSMASPHKAWTGDGREISVDSNWPQPLRVASGDKSTHDFVISCEGLGDDQTIVFDGFKDGSRFTTPSLISSPSTFSFAGDMGEESVTSFRLGITDSWGPWQAVDPDGTLRTAPEMNEAQKETYAYMKRFHVMSDLIGLEGVAGSIDVDYEVLAVDVEGIRHGRKGAGVWNEARASAPFFDLSMIKLDHWEFRLRKVRRWITFSNVSLEAGVTSSFTTTVVPESVFQRYRESMERLSKQRLEIGESKNRMESRQRSFDNLIQHLDGSADKVEAMNTQLASLRENLSLLKKSKDERDRSDADFRTSILEFRFKSRVALNERLKLAKERAAGEEKRIAIVIAKPDSQQADWFYSLLQGTDDDVKRWKVDESAIKEIRQSLPRFQLLWVDAAQFDELRRLIPDHEFEDQHESSMVFLEADGSWLCHFEPDPTKEPRRSLENLGSAVDMHKEGKKNSPAPPQR